MALLQLPLFDRNIDGHFLFFPHGFKKTQNNKANKKSKKETISKQTKKKCNKTKTPQQQLFYGSFVITSKMRVALSEYCTCKLWFFLNLDRITPDKGSTSHTRANATVRKCWQFAQAVLARVC